MGNLIKIQDVTNRVHTQNTGLQLQLHDKLSFVGIKRCSFIQSFAFTFMSLQQYKDVNFLIKREREKKTWNSPTSTSQQLGKQSSKQMFVSGDSVR